MNLGRRSLFGFVGVSTFALLGALLTPLTTQAAVDFAETFTGPTLNNPTNWAASGTAGFPCLTARNSADGTITLGSGSMFGCSATPDATGSGALRLTSAATNQTSTLVYTQPQSTAAGLDITFKIAMYGGTGADGISFYLKDGASTDYSAGLAGGSLGYVNVANALLGIGFDSWGNFSETNSTFNLSGCSTNGPGQRPNSIAVRGPGTRSGSAPYSGYCYLDGTASNAVSFAGADRAAATRDVRILIDPATDPSPKVRVFFAGSSTPLLEIDQPAALRSATSFKFGFSAATGGSTNTHEIWGFDIEPADDSIGGTPAEVVRNVTLTVDPNQGTCSTTSIVGRLNTWANLPPADSCSRQGYELVGFNISADGKGLGFAAGAPVLLSSDNTVYAIWKRIAPAPFMCTADLYQVSGTGGGVIYVYDATRNTMDLVPAGGGTSRASGANAIGYNPADDLIYGIAPNGTNRHLWQFGSNGVYADLGPIVDSATGAPIQNLSFISGDFVADDVLLAIQTPSTMLAVDVAPTRGDKPARGTVQTLPAGVWGAADIAFTSDRQVGYGMSNNVLFIANLPGGDAASQIAAIGRRASYSTKTVLDVPARATYGASYLDQNNNAYFYNNTERRIYLITAAELAKNQPRAVPLGTEKAFVLGTDQTLQVPTDGASCATAPIITVPLTYDINGGTGDTPADQIGFVDQEVTVASGVGFEREDFVFAGWNTAPNGSGASFSPGALFDLGATGGKLYAMWKPVDPTPIVPPQNILEPITEPEPPAEEGEEITFTPLKEIPAPPNDPWNPSSLVLIDPDGGNPTPVVQDESGDWAVNNRTGTVTYLPNPAFSGLATMTIQLQTQSGVRYQSALRTKVPSCEVGQSVRATVYFDVLSSDLDATSKRTLNRLMRDANRKGVPTCTVVVGFVQPTPNRGNDISLSTSRADSVADYLKDRGMNRIVRTEGLGRADEPGAKARRASATIYVAPPAPLTPVD